MEKHYNLNGVLISEHENQSVKGQYTYTWSELTKNSLNMFGYWRGKVYIDKNKDIAYLTSWKSHVLKKGFENFEQAAEYIDNLPRWDKTRFWAKVDDRGRGKINDCMSGTFIKDTD